MSYKIIKKLLIFSVILFALIILSSCSVSYEDPFADFTYNKVEEVIKTEPVIMKDFIISKVVFGKSIPKAKVTHYYTDVTGYFKEYKVDTLQEVKAGDILAILDSSTLDKQFRDQTIAYEKAKLKYQKAKLDFESTGTNENAMLTAKLDFEYEEYKYNNIRLQYDSLEIKAEIDGVVTRKVASPGDFITAKSPIIDITDSSEILISFDSNEANGLRIGDTLEISIRNSTERVNSEIIQINGTEAILKPEYIHEAFSKTGSLVYINILKDKRINALLIDEDSVISEANRYYVYVMEDGVKSERDIKIGISDSGMVEVIFGLTEGELVVINPY